MGMRCTEAEQAVREIGASFSKVQVISMVILLSTDVRTDTSNSILQNQWWTFLRILGGKDEVELEQIQQSKQ